MQVMRMESRGEVLFKTNSPFLLVTVALFFWITVTVAPTTGRPEVLITVPLIVTWLHMLKNGQSMPSMQDLSFIAVDFWLQ